MERSSSSPIQATESKLVVTDYQLFPDDTVNIHSRNICLSDNRNKMSRPYPPRPSDRTHSSTSNQHGGLGRGGRGSSAAERFQVGSIPEHGQVVTNLFRVEYTGDTSNPEHQWHQYRLTVTPLKGIIKYEQAQNNAWKELPNANDTKIERMRASLAENGSTELSRALFRALSDQVWENHGVILAVSLSWEADKSGCSHFKDRLSHYTHRRIRRRWE